MVDEMSLMLKVKEGQIGFLSDLFEANHVSLYNYYLKSGLNRALAEDLVQETFMRVLAYRTTYKAESSFKAWFYRIAKNVVADHFRKLSNRELHETFEEKHQNHSESLTDELEQQAKQSDFDKALSAIPAEHREIIILSRFQQLNYADIAEMLNCNINTLKTRMRTAVANLRSEYRLIAGEVTP